MASPRKKKRAQEPDVLPDAVRLRTYQVGFGDCFLLSFAYAKRSCHVLVDFGSTSLPKGTSMVDVARDIASVCKKGDELVVVVTHRHQDHLSGFATKRDGKGPGDILRALAPRLVVQPWTEAPDAPKRGITPRKISPRASHKLALAAMQDVAAGALHEATLRQRSLGAEATKRIAFLGADGMTNLSAVQNLMTMGKKNRYVAFGDATGIDAIARGVSVRVLGPPTLDQSDSIRKQRTRDDQEFWQLMATSVTPPRRKSALVSPFARHRSKGPLPPDVRWVAERAMRARGQQLLQIVRALDDSLNNTSLILLFQVGDLKLLFPGDAQIENWEYALTGEPHKDEVRALLQNVRLYKVGHHGSRNATPKTLWKILSADGTRRKEPGGLTSVVSTLSGKHGSSASSTEVPRASLVAELSKRSNLRSTQGMKRPYFDITWRRTGKRYVLV